MSLREDLKEHIPMYLWETIDHPEGYIVPNTEFNARWNLVQAQGDFQANTIRDILLMLYETVLHDTDGASHLRVNIPAYNAKNLRKTLEIIHDRLTSGVNALEAHKMSGDHDFRYFTKTQLTNGILDERYYTRAQLDQGQLNHLYYTKEDLVPWLRGGDTLTREEVFIITNPNNGDGTFTYSVDGELYTGVLGDAGEQHFELQDGVYAVGSNRLVVWINDTLRRTAKSGGLVEIDERTFALDPPEGAGAEVTAEYHERLGIAAEYNIKLSEEKPPKSDGRTMWFEVIKE